MNGPSQQAVERFRDEVERLAGRAGCRLGLAVSGGPDSLALLLLGHAAFPGQIQAATVDHRLRPESSAEAAFVAGLCGQMGVPHETLLVEVPKHGNLQAAARAGRYAALAQWLGRHRLDALLTAHHLDDQAETLLMRLVRGHGVRGLAGMRPSSGLPAGDAGQPLLRPLLGWRRTELEALVAAQGLTPVRDPSNVDERFERAIMRRRLGETPWLEPVAIAASARRLAEADDALEWAARAHWDERVSRDGARFSYVATGAPRELRRRTLATLLGRMGTEGTPRGDELDRLLSRLERGEVATLAGVRCSSDEERWSFEPAPPRRRG